MKEFKGSTIFANTVTTADLGTGPVSPSDGHPSCQRFEARRSARTRTGSTYKVMVINKNVSAPHQVALNFASLGLTSQSATVRSTTRAAIWNNSPTVTTQTPRLALPTLICLP